MTNKIIEAARLAGFFIDEDSRKYQPRCIFHTRYLIDDELSRFYVIVRNQALEDAAKVAAIHSQYPIENDFDRGYSKGSRDASERILALKEQQHG